MGRTEFEVMDGSSSERMAPTSSKQSGCYLSTVAGFILVFLAIAITVIVALIVFFSVKPEPVPLNCTVTGIDQISGPGAIKGPGGGWPSEECAIKCIKEGVCDAEPPTKSPATTAATAATSAATAATSAVTAATSTASSGASNSTDKGKLNYRLPRTLVPMHYDIEMKPDIYQNDPKDFTNTGKVKITMMCNETTDTVTLHINKLNVTSDRSLTNEADSSTIELGEPEYNSTLQFVSFHLKENLVKGQNYTLVLGYEGKLKNDLAGLYYSSYNAMNETTGKEEPRYIATTQYQATDARKAFPCFDEPDRKATFAIHLHRKPPMIALSNMPLQDNGTTDVSDGWVKDSFQPTVKMSTYLLAMIICDFESKEKKTSSNVTFRVWSRKDAINQTQFALEEGVQQLVYFEEFFGKPYPLPKQDMIAIPDFAAGAMENWGLITYRETALLYDEKDSAANNKQRVSTVVSHELAHQWFGNLVTPSWWDDLWLNEGFASYVEYIGVNKTQTNWEMMEQFVTMDVQSTLRADSLASSHPIYVPVNNPDEISEIFDSISYGKGGSLIRMMRYFLGDEVFQNALKNYIKENEYEAVFHRVLWNAMQVEAKNKGIADQNNKVLDVTAILDTWLLQMGYPLVEVMMGSESGGQIPLTITQKHFLKDDSQEPDRKYPSPYGYTWDIPISYTTNKEANFSTTDITWFYRKEKELTIEVESDTDWIILNPKQYGFYRVNYPPFYWNRITKQLENNHTVIDPLNRAQLIDDAFNLALAGKLKIDFALSLTEYLAGAENSYFPWVSFFNALSYVDSALSRTQAYGDFQKYMKNIVEPFYNDNNGSWIPNNDQPITTQYKQSLSISRACRYNVLDCREKAHNLLQSFMNNSDTNPIHPNIRPTVYCYGLMEGGAAEWDFLFDRFLHEKVASEKIKLLQSLGCTEQEWLLQRLLDAAVDDSKIRKQDSYIAVSAVTSSKLGQFLTWNWVRANWDFLMDEFNTGGLGMLDNFVASATGGRFTQFDLDEMEAFTAMKGDLKTATRSFAQAKEQTAANIGYLTNNYDDLKDWLSGYITEKNL